jgi:hypothetical protein
VLGRTIGWRFAIALSVLLSCLTSCSPSAQSRSFADVIRDAQSAELNVTDPPARYLADGVGADLLQPMLNRMETELSKYYAGDLLAQKISEHQGEIRAMLSARAGGRVGGVSSVDLVDVQMSGRTARVKARVSVWFKTAQFWSQDPRTRPSATNVMDLDLHLIQNGGRWKIDEEIWRFAPSGGP